MAKSIKSVAQAIGIIGKEVEKMGDNPQVSNPQGDKPQAEPNKYCIECNAEVTHPGAHFCKQCAISFYGDCDKEDDSNGE